MWTQSDLSNKPIRTTDGIRQARPSGAPVRRTSSKRKKYPRKKPIVIRNNTPTGPQPPAPHPVSPTLADKILAEEPPKTKKQTFILASIGVLVMLITVGMGLFVMFTLQQTDTDSSTPQASFITRSQEHTVATSTPTTTPSVAEQPAATNEEKRQTSELPEAQSAPSVTTQEKPKETTRVEEQVKPEPPEQKTEPEDQPTPSAQATSPSIAECDALRNSFSMYPDPESQVERVEKNLRASDPDTASILRTISCYPQTIWLVGGSPASVASEVRSHVQAATAQGKTPVFVLYNIPDVWSSKWYADFGGASYAEWIEAIAEAIGSNNAWVVLEPDALITIEKYSDSDRDISIGELRGAVQQLSQKAPGARIYIDAGHSKWASSARSAALLNEVGVAVAHGFSLNVSNYHTTEGQIAYGNSISATLGGKKFIVDTSRNGIGPTSDYEWCNAPGRALGAVPNFNPAGANLDALLWIKPPGESDGLCNGGPQAGDFWVEYAVDLVRNRK